MYPHVLTQRTYRPSSDPLNSGLVGWWDANPSWLMQDKSVGFHHADAAGIFYASSISFLRTRLGWAYHKTNTISGKQAYFQPTNVDLSQLTELSLVAALQPRRTSRSDFVGSWNGVNGSFLLSGGISTASRFQFWVRSTGNYHNAQDTTNFSTNEIYFLVGTYSQANSRRLRLYRNGKQVASANATADINTSTVDFTILTSDDSDAAASLLAVKLYRRELDANEVENLYRDWLNGYPRTLHNRPLWLPNSASGGVVNITPASAAHSHTADQPTITQTHAVTVAESLHSHVADQPTITQTHGILVDKAYHSQTADEPQINQYVEPSFPSPSSKSDSYNGLFQLGKYTLDADCLAWLPCQDNAATTTVVDEYSTNDGTLAGGDNTEDKVVTGPTSYMASALEMNGVDDYIYLPAATNVTGNTERTYIFWLKPLEFDTGSNIPIICWASQDVETQEDGRRFMLCAEDNALSLPFQGHRTITPKNDLSTSTWYHIAVRVHASAVDTDEVEVFINGVNQPISTENGTAQILNTVTANTNEPAIGRFLRDSEFGNFQIADYAAFDRDLSDLEIAQHYNGPEPTCSVEPTVSGTYQEDQTLTITSDGTWGLDSTISGSNGTISYSYYWVRADDSSGTNPVVIPGATSSTYQLVSADVGKYVSPYVRATNDGGFGATEDTRPSGAWGGPVTAATVNITPAAATHAHAAEQPTITQTHLITVSESLHSHTADQPTITQTHEVAADEATHAHTADQPAITQTHVVVAAEALHSHAADNVTVTAGTAIDPQEATHGHTADQPVITQTHVIVVAEAAHAHAVDEPSVTQTHLLTPDEASHLHTADQPSITQTHVIVVAEALHSHTADEPTITQTHLLVVDEANHTHTADQPTITQTHVVVAQEASHAHTADNVTLQLGGVQVDPAEAVHAHTADEPAITQTHVVVVAEAIHSHTVDNVTLTVDVAIVPAEATHAHAADEPTITQTHVIVAADAIHGHTADQPTVTQTHIIVPAEALHTHTADEPLLFEEFVFGGWLEFTAVSIGLEFTAAAKSKLEWTVTGSRPGNVRTTVQIGAFDLGFDGGFQ